MTSVLTQSRLHSLLKTLPAVVFVLLLAPTGHTQQNQQRLFLTDGAGQKIVAFTISSDSSQTVEFLTSQGQSFARFSNHDSAAHLDLLSADGHAGLFASTTHALTITSILAKGLKKTIVDDEGFLGAPYSHGTNLANAKMNMRTAIPITAPSGATIALLMSSNRTGADPVHDMESHSSRVFIRLFDPSGNTWAYATLDFMTSRNTPPDSPAYTYTTVPRYTLDLYDTRGFKRVEASYFGVTAAIGQSPPAMINTQVFLTDPNNKASLPEPQKPNSIDPSTLALVPFRYFPGGSFSWLSVPDIKAPPPLRLLNESGQVLAAFNE
ncbi:MAG TPA: hypothetical protein VKS20_09005 [Candidatus Acidoferrales bacterium]|nr:hypothetical protein [Candidatus Acidoferrales bacterium]